MNKYIRVLTEVPIVEYNLAPSNKLQINQNIYYPHSLLICVLLEFLVKEKDVIL